MIQDIELVAASMARESIYLALEDVKKHGNGGVGASALRWFNEREQGVFGYGWCLVRSSANPNQIRTVINHNSPLI
jgi:hypothetical protein